MLLSIVEMSRMILVYTSRLPMRRMPACATRSFTELTIPALPSAVGTSCAPTSCTAGVAQVVQEYASTGLINPSNLTATVSLPNSSNAAGKTVQVTVTYTYDPMVSYFSSKLNVNMGATSEGVIVF